MWKSTQTALARERWLKSLEGGPEVSHEKLAEWRARFDPED